MMGNAFYTDNVSMLTLSDKKEPADMDFSISADSL